MVQVGDACGAHHNHYGVSLTELLRQEQTDAEVTVWDLKERPTPTAALAHQLEVTGTS